MIPIPEADEEARRAHRERQDLTGERRSIVNKIDGAKFPIFSPDYRDLKNFYYGDSLPGEIEILQQNE